MAVLDAGMAHHARGSTAPTHTRGTSRHGTLSGGDEHPCHKGFPMVGDRHRHIIPTWPLHDTASQRLTSLCYHYDVHHVHRQPISTSLS
jgi:hypothetical protein